MSKPPEILDQVLLAKGRLFSIESVHLRFSNGEERDYERIQGRVAQSVIILPILDEHTVLLVREYAVGIESYVLGFPKGGVAPNETVLETAQRELQEEVGYAARDLRSVLTFSSSPGYSTGSVQLLVARGLYESRLVGDEPELIESVPFSLSQVDQLMRHPEFVEARSMLALLWLEREWRAQRI